jgi:phosphoribosylglycinamide formyltransferase 1
MTSTPSIAILCSGGGSNLQILLEKAQSGDLCGRIGFVAGNNSKAHSLERARKAGVPTYHVSTATEGSSQGVSDRLIALIQEHQVDYLVLAGYMRPLPAAVLELLPMRVVNVHPALLPAFGGQGMFGQRVHEAVIERGAQWTGVTVHLVSEDYDEGPILWQRIVAVHPGDSAETLGQRVLAVEHDTLWKVMRAFCQKRVTISGKSVHVQGGWNESCCVSMRPGHLQ